MIVLEPLEHQTIWGGHILHDDYFCQNDKTGHLYMVNGHDGMSNRILNGEYIGKTLAEAFEQAKYSWGMSEYSEFPLTIALVDASENLSIQVHPDDLTAQKIEGKKLGKEESWIFLNAPKSGNIYCGCNAKSKQDICEAIQNNDFTGIAAYLPVQRNSYVCVKAGTLHAMTAGSLVYEIEYGSDFTYRFYDYKRKNADGNERELHIDKALSAIDLNQKSEAVEIISDKWISEKYYEICKIANKNSYVNNSEKIVILSILNGTALCDGIKVRKGMSILMLPGETIDGCDLQEAVVSRMK